WGGVVRDSAAQPAVPPHLTVWGFGALAVEVAATRDSATERWLVGSRTARNASGARGAKPPSGVQSARSFARAPRPCQDGQLVWPARRSYPLHHANSVPQAAADHLLWRHALDTHDRRPA